MTVVKPFDVCIVGAGLIGLAVGRAALVEFPEASLLIVDKEDRIAAHQSSHNSGVVHSGLYYRPGSLKARLCVEGRDAMYAMCEAAGIPYARSGKLVIATDEGEIPTLDTLEERGRANGLVGMSRLGPDQIGDVEPAATGVAALHVPQAGVADYGAVAAHLADTMTAAGAIVATREEVEEVVAEPGGGLGIRTSRSRFSARVLINCAGLHADRVAARCGLEPSVRIVPFRGEYYRLAEPAASEVRALVYPVPDPRFPFLGVHFTRRIDGSVEVGPNAVLAMGREHYRGASVHWGDLCETLRYRGFRRLARRHWRSGITELVNSRSRIRYAQQARRLMPGVRRADLLPGGAGVRAQAVAADGSLVDDFVIERAGSIVHVLNAPSPGATASIAIGRHIVSELRPLLGG